MAQPVYGYGPYSALRKRAQVAALPSQGNPAQDGPDPGQTQPYFPSTPDPMDAQDPANPIPQGRMPLDLSGDRSKIFGLNENMRDSKFATDVGRSKMLDVNKTPDQYYQDLQTVQNSPLMQKLAETADQERQLRENFIRNMPVQSDLSPTMALADYIAKGKGTAQGGYTRPMSYQEITGNIGALLGAEGKSRIAQSQLALQQAGTLKAGEQKASTDTGLTQGQQQGSKEEQLHQPLMQPMQQVRQIGEDYEKQAKAANDVIATGVQIRKNLANPNWLSDKSIQGEAVKNIGFQRVTGPEFFIAGGGSQSLADTIDRTIQRAQNGQSLTDDDRKVIGMMNEINMKAAIAQRDEIKRRTQTAYQGVTTLPADKVNDVTNMKDTPVPPAAQQGDPNAKAAAIKQMMDMMATPVKK